jgi:tetratricopeptide (TPR) repeat protein
MKESKMDAKVLWQSGQQQRCQGQFERATDTFRRAIQADPDGAQYHFSLAVSLFYDHGQHVEAITEYKEAIRLAPEMNLARYNLGLLLTDIGEYSEAVATFRELLSRSPNFAAAYVGIGHTQLQMHQFDAALQSFQQAIAQYEDYFEAQLGICDVWLASGRNDEALRCLSQLVDRFPHHPLCYLRLGQLYSLIGDNEMAQKQFADAINLSDETDAAIANEANEALRKMESRNT